MTYQPDLEKLSAFFARLSEADTLIRLMVQDELKATKLPELVSAEENAARDLQEAVAALEKPESALAELEAELSKAASETRSWQAQAQSDDISARVTAKSWFAEWTAELDTLTAKREAMERDILPLRQARDEAQQRLFWASRDRADIELNVSDPALAYIGWGPSTDAFTWWLPYFAGRTLHFGQRDEMGIESGRLREKALDYLSWLCERTGFRTDKLSQRDALNISREWDEIYRNANQPEPAGHDVRQLAQGGLLNELAQEKAHELSARLDEAAAADWRGDSRAVLENAVRVTPAPEKDYQRLSSIRA